ncbi:MAG TPA: M28 family peptidase [Jiangellaceae bacterium]|nr:M28 family peptidase [Jiangellaceae bacterium]
MGAEESGLLGSEHYVANLTDEEIEDVFETFYTSRGLPFQDTEFSGRSDYGPFIAVGVPAGGLFTGAEGVKTAAEAVTYGGVAGAAYDPCYHQFCDNLRGDGQDVALYDALREDYNLVGNVNTFAFDVNADAVATAVLTFAFDTSTLPAVPCRGAQRRVQGSCLTRTGNPWWGAVGHLADSAPSVDHPSATDGLPVAG